MSLEMSSCSATPSRIESLLEAEGVEVMSGMKSVNAARTLEMWHEGVNLGLKGEDSRLLDILDVILDDNILFLAPTYLKERRDKKFVKLALVGVTKAFKNFKYSRAMLFDDGFALEFECNIETPDGPVMRGVDLVTLDKRTGKIIKFEVMARPPKPVMKLLDFQTKFLRENGILAPSKSKL